MPELRLCNRLRWCGLGGLLLLWSLAAPSLAQIVRPLDFSHSHWLWYPATPQPPEVYLRHSFRLEVPIASAHLLITADDGYEAFVNGQRVGRGEDWEHPDTYDLAGLLEPGLNVLAVRAWNREGPAGVIATLRVVVQGGRMIEWPSDATWRVWAERVEGWERVEFDDSVWLPAHLVGAYPCPPWGRLVKMSAAEMRAWLEEQPLTLEVEVVPHPPHSEFRAAYLDPAFAARYTSFLTLDRERGLILTPEGPRPFLWVHYTQPGPTPADPPVSSPLDFDYDLLEEDLPRLAKLGANPAVSGLDWRHLLRANGTWRELAAPPRGRNLPEFQYAYEVYDYFFDRVQAHGLYALVLMDYRSFLPKEVLTPERLANVLLYDPLWRTILRATQKIARYFSRRPVIAAWALGADGLPFAPGWDSPLLRERFQQFLAAHYGRVENLKTMWGTEYDLQAGEAALWPERTLPSGRRVRVPQLRRTPEVFAAWNYFADVPLPPCPPYREPEPPYKPVTEAEPALEAVRESPMWVDFNAFREELLLQRLNEWATAMQEAAPHHLLQYGQQAPFATVRERPVVFNYARLDFDLLGGGTGRPGPVVRTEQPAPASGYAEMLASFQGYLRTRRARPRGLAYSGGMLLPTRRHLPRLISHHWADLIGGGGTALLLGPDWTFLTGRRAATQRGVDETTLRRIADFVRRTAGLRFPRAQAEILILRNRYAAWSLWAEPDAAGAEVVGEVLRELHLPFDILTDADVTLNAAEPDKVDLNGYRFIFVPALHLMLPDTTWALLRRWLEDENHAGERGLCLGRFAPQDGYFKPLTRLPKDFLALAGLSGYAKEESVSGERTFSVTRPFGNLPAGERVTLPFSSPQGQLAYFSGVLPPEVEPLLSLPVEGPKAALYPEGRPVLVRRKVKGNQVYLAGFNLGLADDPQGRELRPPPEGLRRVYRSLLVEAGLRPTLEAPPNVDVYLAENGEGLLLKESYGRSRDQVLTTTTVRGAVYEDAETELLPDGTVRIRRSLGPYQALCLRRVATVAAPRAATTVTVRARPNNLQPLRFSVRGTGPVEVQLHLAPQTEYVVLANDREQQFTTDATGRVAFRLTAQAQPTLVTVAATAPQQLGPLVAREISEHFLVASQFLTEGKVERAVGEYRTIVARFPHTVYARQAEEALTVLEQQLAGTEVEEALARAAELRQAGQFEAALREYRDLLVRFADTAIADHIQAGLVATEIARLEAGPHRPLPPLQAAADAPGPEPVLVLTNGPRHTFTVYFAGPTVGTRTVSPGERVRLPLLAGEYRLAVVAVEAGVPPFLGRVRLAEGRQYALALAVPSL